MIKMKHTKTYSILTGLASILLFCSGSFAAAQNIISQEDLEYRPATSVATALDGLDASLVTRLSSGNPSAEAIATLRGIISIVGNTPLVLVDGVESALERVVPADVESITILKDASAAAIYGARAAAGAILIKTRTGKNFQGANAEMQASLFTGKASSAHTDNFHVSARGGGDLFNYYLGAHYLGQGSALDSKYGNGRLDNLGMVANFDARITRWMRYSLGVNYHYKERNFPWWQGENAFYQAVDAGADLSPYYSAMEAGSLYQRSKEHGFVFRNALEATLLKEIVAGVSYSINNRFILGQYRSSEVEGVDEGTAPNHYRETRTDFANQEVDAGASWSHRFAKAHKISARIGYDWQDTHYKQIGISVNNLIDPTISAISVGDGHYTVTEPIRKTAQMGLYGRLAYDFKGRYAVNATYRRDASSRYAPDDRWAGSFATAAEWTISEEPFFASLKGVAELFKIRYSYGDIASQIRDAAYPWLVSISTSNPLPWLFDRNGTATYDTFADDTVNGYTWERVTTHDAGFDLAALGGRLTLSGDAFIRKTTDMLVPAALMPGILGAGNAQIGGGEMKSTGYELSLGWSDRAGSGSKPVRYSVNASYSDVTSEITFGPYNAEPRLPIAHGICALRCKAGWDGIDFGAILQGVGSFQNDFRGKSDNGYFRIKSITAGYTFRFPKLDFIRSIRLGAAAENIWSSAPVPLAASAEAIPESILANLILNF